MNSCGIDLSLSGTGLVVLNSKSKILVNTLISTKADLQIEERIRYIWKYINRALNQYKESIKVNVEGLAFSLRGQRSLELSGLHYYIRTNLKVKRISFVITPPTSLKKFVTGKGNCKKNLMLLSVYKKWGHSFGDDNIADAYSLARFLQDPKSIQFLPNVKCRK